MTKNFDSSKDRAAQVIYVAISAIALGFIIASPIMLLTSFVLMFDEYSNRNTIALLPGSAVVAILGLCIYGMAWSIRWIINGISSSVLDYWLPADYIRRKAFSDTLGRAVPPRDSKEYLDWANREGQWADRKE